MKVAEPRERFDSGVLGFVMGINQHVGNAQRIQHLQHVLDATRAELAQLAGSREPALPSGVGEILDALPGEILLLDDRGVVVFANRAWTRAVEHGGGVIVPGTSYLGACRTLSGGTDTDVHRVAEAVRSALGGTATTCTFEWRRERARASGGCGIIDVAPYTLPDGARGVIICHREHDVASANGERAAHARALPDTEHGASVQIGAILGALSIGVHVIDREGRILYENDTALRWLGARASTLVGTFAHEAIHHRRADGIPYPVEACPIHQTLCDGRARTITDEVFFRQDGSSFPVEYVCAPLRDHNGDIEGVVVSFRDVSEERKTRSRLDEHQALLRSAQTLAGMGIWELDVATGRLRWSEETLALFGLTADMFEETYDAFLACIVPEDRANVLAAHARARETGIIEAQYRIVRPDGSMRWLYERGDLERDEHGAPLRRLGVVMDVTSLNTALAAQRAGEAALRRVFASAVSGMAIGTMDGKILDANPAYCRILGYSESELRELGFLSITHPDDLPANLQLMDELSGGTRDSFINEKRYLKKSGDHVWVRISVALVRGADDAQMKLIAVVEDIDEQRRTMDSLMQREHMLRVASRIGRLGGWSVSLPDRVVQLSDETRAIYELDSGTDPDLEEVVGYFVPDHRTRMRDAFDACMTDGTPFELEVEIITSRGRRCCVRAIGEAMRDDKGAIRTVQGALQDISDRKAFERSLRESERRFRAFADSMPIIIWTARPDGSADYANRPMLGASLDPAQPADGRWVSPVHPSDRSRAVSAWQDSVATGTPYQIELRLRGTDGDYRWHLVSASAARDDAGDIVKWYGTAIDVDATFRAEERARRLAGELAAAFESISDALFTSDARGHFTYTNARACTLARRPADRLVGTAIADAFPAPVSEAVIKAVTAALHTMAPAEIEVQDPRCGAWLVGRAYPAEDRCVVFLRDETETRRAREAVRVSEERFRLLCRATNDAIWDWDLVTNALWWNEGFETMFGYRRDEVESTIDSWSTRVHPEDYEEVVPAVNRAIAEGQASWTSEYRFRRADGTWAYVLDRGSVIYDATGCAVRMVGGMTDLTERKATEERLTEQAALLEAARDAILVRDLGGKIRYLNKRAEELYGWTRESAVGASVVELQFARNRGAFEAANTATLRDGQWTGEIEMTCADGSVVLVEGRWSLLHTSAGVPYGVLAINTDIRERKRLEQQLLRTQRMESIGTLAGGIAHDLNNVLTPILFAVGMLRDDERDPERLEDLANIEACARRGSAMIRQLLMFARGYEGKRAAVSILHVIRDVERIVRDTFPKNITLHMNVPCDVWPLDADATQLNQVIMNLCVNARDAMPFGGKLVISVKNVVLDEIYAGMNPHARPGTYVAICVEDTGTGMAPEIAERAFEPFFTTKPLGQGTGLGLSTTHAIVKNHGGFINLYSEPGRGTRFHIHLPATQVTVDQFTADRPADQNRAVRGHGECVLVVDDEEPIRTMVERTLKRFGYRVIVAANGAEAMALYVQRRGEIAAVLTDIAMPVMDGAALIVALRSLDASIKIIGSSGLDADDKSAAATGAVAEHFVGKPYTAETLLRVLAEVLR